MPTEHPLSAQAAVLQPTVLMLAAGRGERYRAAGGTTHKLQALLDGRTLLECTLDAVRASGLPWHVEAGPHPGMGDAIAAAVRATADSPGWLVLPADMPLVRAATLQAVADALRAGHAAAQPVVGGRPGHPVGFGAGSAPELMALQGDEGARRVLAALRASGQVMELAVEDDGILEDVDTPEDLERIRRLWQARKG